MFFAIENVCKCDPYRTKWQGSDDSCCQAMLRMIHAFDRIVFTLGKKTQYSHVHNEQAEQRTLFWLMCFSDSVSNHCVRGWKVSSALVIMMFFLILIRFSWVNGRIGSNPPSHGCGRACVRRVWTRAPTREIPPPSCVDYLHCSNGISSHRL